MRTGNLLVPILIVLVVMVCCIGPVMLTAGGVGFLSRLFARKESWVLLGLVVVLLAALGYRKMKEQ